jgi:hypothetical protein
MDHEEQAPQRLTQALAIRFILSAVRSGTSVHSR